MRETKFSGTRLIGAEKDKRREGKVRKVQRGVIL